MFERSCVCKALSLPAVHTVLAASLAFPLAEQSTTGSGGITGQVLAELRVALQRRPVTEAMKQRALDNELQRIDLQKSEGGGETYTKDELKRIAWLTPASDSMPLIVSMYTAPDGTVWVLDNTAAGGTEGTVATAFPKAGAMLGRLAIGAATQPVAFGADRVVLRATDEDDVVAIKVYRLVR